MPPYFSLIVCTRDRAGPLARMLASVVEAACRIDCAWECIVVDNGSSDDTAQVAQSFADRLPLRLVREDRAGVSHARNRGSIEARGEWIIFADDDVILDRDFLFAYRSAFDRFADVDFMGGQSRPLFLAPQRKWFVEAEDALCSLLARRNDIELVEITPDNAPYSLNFAIRRELQLRFPYDPALGVAPGRRLGGEETDVIVRAMAAGARGRWLWQALVHHAIPPERQTLRYVWTFYVAMGALYPNDSRWRGAAYRSYVRAVAARKLAAAAIKRAVRNPTWIRAFRDAAQAIGSLDSPLAASPAPHARNDDTP